MDRLTNALITAAALAGRYRSDARIHPDRAAGWERMADRWSAVAARLSSDLARAAQQREGATPRSCSTDGRR
jgi:hypothetical protein